MAQPKAVVIDDDTGVARLVRECLEDEGFEVFPAADGVEALRILDEAAPEIVVLDLMLPELDGLEVLKSLRQWSEVPVIILSARNEIHDKTRCLDLGADDYLTKPFSIEELLARIKALLRRPNMVDADSVTPPFSSGELHIDFEKREVSVAGKVVNLTFHECRLLIEMVHNAGKTLTYEQLLQRVWGPEYGSEKQYLHVHISNLRKKIQTDQKQPEYIITVPSVGYRFRDKA